MTENAEACMAAVPADPDSTETEDAWGRLSADERQWCRGKSAALNERARIVAWLRKVKETYWGDADECIDLLTARIEAGDHLK